VALAFASNKSGLGLGLGLGLDVLTSTPVTHV